MILRVLLFAAALSACLAVVPKQAKQATRGDVVERLAKAALHPARPRRSGTPCPTLPAGTAPPSTTSEGDVYTQYYAGSGVTEDPQNPGNDDAGAYPPHTTDIGFLDIPDAVQRCSDLSVDDPWSYLSFDLHFLTSTCTWICVQYYDLNNDPVWWDQADPDVAIAYGYSQPAFF